MPVDLPIQPQLDVFSIGMLSWTNADASGHTFANPRGGVTVWVDNPGSDITVTLQSKRDSNFGIFPDKVFTVPGGVWSLPTLAPERFTDAGTGLAEFTLSSIAGVKLAAVSLFEFYKET